MKVILLRDVAKIGRQGTVVEVPDGYAQNKLFPNKLAKPANAATIKQVDQVSTKRKEAAADEHKKFTNIVRVLEEHPLQIVAHLNAQGHMFEALKVQALMSALSTHVGEQVDAKHIKIQAPIKSKGEHTIELVWNGGRKEVSIIISN
jgi:large subunit ribosomal protein L9